MLGTDLDFILRLLLNMVAVFVLVRFVYFRAHTNRAYAAAFILFGLGVFLVTSQLSSVDISMGFAFGLFAIFSMLRYRTESITINEMTYLFLVIAMSLLSGVGVTDHVTLVVLFVLICALAYFTETNLLLPSLEQRDIQYEKIENIVPERREALMADLRERLGEELRTVEIESVDFLRDTARLKVQIRPVR